MDSLTDSLVTATATTETSFALDHYSTIVQQVLQNLVDLCNQATDRSTDTFLVSDPINSHYIWMTLGWQNSQRVCGITVYIRLHQNKVWIEEDCTEDGIALNLIAAGIPQQDIVLGLHSPPLRPYTAFAAT